MDDYLTRAAAGGSVFDPPPILIAGDSDDAFGFVAMHSSAAKNIQRSMSVTSVGCTATHFPIVGRCPDCI